MRGVERCNAIAILEFGKAPFADDVPVVDIEDVGRAFFEVGGYVRGEQHAYVLASGQLEKDIQHFFARSRVEPAGWFIEDEQSCVVREESAPEEFDVSTMQKTKIKKGMSSTMSVNRNIDNLMDQLEETFSQRLLRMIDERGMTDSEAYTKAYVDRRHFSKIRKDVNYAPNKKTVLAFTIALELSLDEAKDLLASAGFALSRSSKTDIIVAYFLQNKIYDMFEINDVLDAYGQPVF